MVREWKEEGRDWDGEGEGRKIEIERERGERVRERERELNQKVLWHGLREEKNYHEKFWPRCCQNMGRLHATSFTRNQGRSAPSLSLAYTVTLNKKTSGHLPNDLAYHVILELLVTSHCWWSGFCCLCRWLRWRLKIVLEIPVTASTSPSPPSSSS